MYAVIDARPSDGEVQGNEKDGIAGGCIGDPSPRAPVQRSRVDRARTASGRVRSLANVLLAVDFEPERAVETERCSGSHHQAQREEATEQGDDPNREQDAESVFDEGSHGRPEAVE